MEVWKDLIGYEGKYRISSEGRIYSISKDIILKHNIDKNGYCRISLYKNKKRKTKIIHRLVALTFIENPKNKPTVNHINGIKTDNRVENLEWSTYSEQAKHSIAIGLHRLLKGEKSKSSKLTNDKIKQINELLENSNLTQKEISLKFNISESVISLIKNGKSWNDKEIKRNYKPNQGINNPLSKLTDEIVYEIKDKLTKGKTRKEIEIEYNISKTLVQLIATEKNWGHVKHPDYKYQKKSKGYKLNEEKVRQIHIDRLNGMKQKELQHKYNISRSCIQSILYGKQWKEIYNEFKKEG